MFMTAKQAAEKWGLSDRRVRILCAEGKIPGAFQEGRGWKIPMDAVKPADGRFKSAESLLEMIDRKKAELDTRRPLTEGEVARLTEEFTVEYTYNSNAIEGNTLQARGPIFYFAFFSCFASWSAPVAARPLTMPTATAVTGSPAGKSGTTSMHTGPSTAPSAPQTVGSHLFASGVCFTPSAAR